MDLSGRIFHWSTTKDKASMEISFSINILTEFYFITKKKCLMCLKEGLLEGDLIMEVLESSID